MSFILDALRKSEIERQRQSGPSVAEFPVAREDRRLPVALVVIGFLLAVNLAVVLFFMLRDEPGSGQAAPPAAAPAATTAAATPAPTATAPSESSPAGPSPLESAALPADPYETEPPAVYYEPPTRAPDAPDPTLLPSADANPGVPAVATAGDEYASVAAATGLPELTVDLHIYATDPAKRAVFINGHRYTRGARLSEGPLVEDITPDGALLSYRGRRFLLPRL
jgi:general secretion pathway protein B